MSKLTASDFIGQFFQLSLSDRCPVYISGSFRRLNLNLIKHVTFHIGHKNKSNQAKKNAQVRDLDLFHYKQATRVKNNLPYWRTYKQVGFEVDLQFFMVKTTKYLSDRMK